MKQHTLCFFIVLFFGLLILKRNCISRFFSRKRVGSPVKRIVYCAVGTASFTVSASDALNAVRLFVNRNIKLAAFLTNGTMDAFFFVHLKAHKRNGVEKPVHCTERAEITAKRSVNKNGKHNKYNKYCRFPCKQPSQHCL